MITAQRIDANERMGPWMDLTADQRDELCAWLTDHGIEPCETLAVELDVMDIPLIRAEQYDRDADGRIPLVGTGTSVGPRKTTIEVAQRMDPPTWWQPHA